MDASHNPLLFKDTLILLATAGIAVPLMQKLKINSIVSFLLLGAVLGPFGLGAHLVDFPWLDNFVVMRSEGLTLLGDLGVVFLLFLIGMELSIQRLITRWRFVFGMGGLQVAVCALSIAFICSLMGMSQKASAIIGAAFALSSTAIIIQFLARQKQLNSASGRACFSVLLLQDLAVIPMLFLLNFHDDQTQHSLAYGLAIALGQAVVIVAAIYAAGRIIVRPLFRLVASTESPDLFVATTLLFVIGSAVISASAGISMSLGAFIAGLLISETEYSHAISSVVEPFKGLFLGLFFFTVGMGIDIDYVIRNPALVGLCALGLIAIKAALTAPIIRLFGVYWSSSVKSALLLGPAGEFAFVIIALALAGGILTQSEGALAVSVASITMSMIPLKGRIGSIVAKRFKKTAPHKAIIPPMSETENVEALVVGLRRVGSMACELLARHNIRFVAIDHDMLLVDSLRAKGVSAYYGNGADPMFLEKCGIHSAKTVIITSHNRAEVDAIVNVVRGLKSDIRIISRAHDADHAKHLYRMGVFVAVPETIEASLQLAEAALNSLGCDKMKTIDTINEKRENIRSQLQLAQGVA